MVARDGIEPSTFHLPGGGRRDFPRELRTLKGAVKTSRALVAGKGFPKKNGRSVGAASVLATWVFSGDEVDRACFEDSGATGVVAVAGLGTSAPAMARNPSVVSVTCTDIGNFCSSSVQRSSITANPGTLYCPQWNGVCGGSQSELQFSPLRRLALRLAFRLP